MGRRVAYNAPMPTTDAALDAHLDQTRDARLESYKAFLRIPSISAMPGHADDCRRPPSGWSRR